MISPLTGQKSICLDFIADRNGKAPVGLHEVAEGQDATWRNDLTWLATRAINGGPYVLLGLSAFAAGSACTLGASCYIWTKIIIQAGAKKFGSVKIRRHMDHTIPDSVDYHLLMQTPKTLACNDLLLKRFVIKAGCMILNSRRSGERPSSSTPQTRSPPTSFPRSRSSFAKLSHPINSHCYCPVIVAISMRFPFLICTSNTRPPDQSLYPHPLASKVLASAAVTSGKSCPKGTNCSFNLSLFEVVLRAGMRDMLKSALSVHAVQSSNL
jgi:hypothetical protein